MPTLKIAAPCDSRHQDWILPLCELPLVTETPECYILNTSVSSHNFLGIGTYKNVLNTKLSPPCMSSSSLLLRDISWSHHSPAFSVHSFIHIGHFSPTISWLQSQDHKPLFPVCCTSLVEQVSSCSSVCVPYQFDPHYTYLIPTIVLPTWKSVFQIFKIVFWYMPLL